MDKVTRQCPQTTTFLLCSEFAAFILQSSGQGGKITNRQDYTSSGRVYDKGECTFTSPAPTEGGQYTFSVDFYPSAGGHVVKTLTIPERNGGNVDGWAMNVFRY